MGQDGPKMGQKRAQEGPQIGPKSTSKVEAEKASARINLKSALFEDGPCKILIFGLQNPAAATKMGGVSWGPGGPRGGI